MKNMDLYNGDCLEVMKSIPDKSIDLTVTSPPYDNLRTYNNTLNWNFDIFKNIANELFRVTKVGGVTVWVVGDATINGSETGTSFKHALYFMECGFNLHDTMIWNKDTIPLTHNRYEQKFEYMFVFSKGKPKTFNGLKEACIHAGRSFPSGKTRQGGDKLREYNKKEKTKENKLLGNVWFLKTGFIHATKDKLAYKHPAIFPEKLANDHIVSWSNENDLVFDPFMGSGTTGKMAKLLKRKFIGIELEENYFNIAKKRIAETVYQGELF